MVKLYQLATQLLQNFSVEILESLLTLLGPSPSTAEVLDNNTTNQGNGNITVTDLSI
jgi:hypothetical protein